MLIVFSNVILLSIQWLCDRWRQQRYVDILSTAMNRMSLVIQRCQPVRFQRYEAAGIFKMSLTAIENDMEMLASPRHLLMKDDYIVMHEMKSWVTVDLSSWVTYNYPIQQKDVDSSKFQILLEAVPCLENKSANRAHDLSHHVLTFGIPLAWRCDDQYAVIMNCDNMDSMVRMVDAFGQQQLVVSDGLDVTSIGTVKTNGSPRAISISHEIFSPAKDKKEEEYLINDTESSKEVILPNTDSTDLVKAEQFSTSSTNETSSVCNQTTLGNELTNDSNVFNETVIPLLPKTHSKPPNILIYTGVKDSKRKYDNASDSIKGCLNTDSYTIYHLKQEHILTTPWQDNTVVLVISSCARLSTEVSQKVSEFVFNYGGNLLNFGSSADNMFENHLDIIKTDNKEEITMFDFGEWRSVSSCCGQFMYSNCRGDSNVVVPVLVENLSRDNAANVVKLNLHKGGIVILSQLFLEQDPVSQAKNKASFDLLKKSNNSRLAVLRELLALMGLDIEHATPPALTPCHLIAQKEGLKESFLASFKSRLQNGILKSQNLSLSLQIDKNQTQAEPQATLLPVLTHNDNNAAAFEYFNMSDYWHHLKTSSLGQIVMYTDVIASTMPVFDGLLFSIPKGMTPIAIAGRQVQGKGRAGNTWLSPSGCAMFSLPLCVSLHSNLGQRVSFLQHMVSLAVVRGVLSLPGYQDLDLRLKWPNDIYYGKEMKLGGVLVISTVMGNYIYATVGCGVNVTNSDPTICINDIIQHRNASNSDLPPLKPLTTGQVIARCLSVLEQLIGDFEMKDHKYISELYCQHWLHGGTKVKVELETKTEGEIVGLDDYGFLSIRTKDGKLIVVQPDGNSFDMMHNLIHFKTEL